MSLELVNTFATLGTFVVIAATATAAIVQLRHARGSNQIAALNELRETSEGPELQEAERFVFVELTGKLKDPSFRYQVANRSARTAEYQPLISQATALGNFYEGMGALVKAGLVDRELALEQYTQNVLDAWEALTSIAAIVRRKRGRWMWENFEFLTVLCQDWLAAHPEGTYPAKTRRIDLKDEWREADEEYVASLAPA